MLRSTLIWSALTAFTLLNVGGEALHHAEFLGFHSHGQGATGKDAASPCSCAFHVRVAARKTSAVHAEIDSQDGHTSEHHCPLCQYYAQAKSSWTLALSAVDSSPLSPDSVVTPTICVRSASQNAWFARGPPLS